MSADKMDVDAPAPEAQPEDILGNGGVLKTVLVEAPSSNWEKPQAGSEVFVHYTGTLLNGEKFDSSLDRNQPFSFIIDSGSVIKGWDAAVKTMAIGEKSKFVLTPEFAYGASGSPPKIPPDSTLVFEIELLRFTNEKDLTKDGGVLKKIVKESPEKYGQSPKYETKCCVNYTCKHGDTLIEEKKNFEFTIGEDDCISGFEKAVESMKVGEEALFTIAPAYAYGTTGNPSNNIPANATLKYQIELLEMHKEKEDWELNGLDEKIEAAKKRKDQGNSFYSKGKIDRAARKYTRALEFVNYLGGKPSAEDKEKANAVKLAIHLNLAQCYLKTKDNAKAIEQSKKALEIEPTNTKALCRQGIAYAAIVDWESAKKCFIKALEKEPSNPDVRREYAKVQAAIKEQDNKDRAVFAKMFA